MELSVYCGALDSPARAAALSERLLVEARTRNHPLLYAYTLGGDVLVARSIPRRPACGVTAR
jgi:hypothetical protein